MAQLLAGSINNNFKVVSTDPFNNFLAKHILRMLNSLKLLSTKLRIKWNNAVPDWPLNRISPNWLRIHILLKADLSVSFFSRFFKCKQLTDTLKTVVTLVNKNTDYNTHTAKLKISYRCNY